MVKIYHYLLHYCFMLDSVFTIPRFFITIKHILPHLVIEAL